MDHKHLRGRFTFRVEESDNGTYVASMIQRNEQKDDDAVGALYYVVVVILIYGCSILMMIASYIRKNNTDRKLNRYLKEMANVRKRECQQQLITAAARAAAQSRKNTCTGEHGDRDQDPPTGAESTSGALVSEGPDNMHMPSGDTGVHRGHEGSHKQRDVREYEHLHPTKILQGPSTDASDLQHSDIVSIVIETSDGESESEAFLGGSGCSARDGPRPGYLSRMDSLASSDPGGDQTADRQRLLLDLDDSEAPLDDSESDQQADRAEVSEKLQWTDFHVMSSV